MAIWQLGNCALSGLKHQLCAASDVRPTAAGYLLLGLISTFVFRAVRDTLPGNAAAQERILGASFTALALADVSRLGYFCFPGTSVLLNDDVQVTQ